MLQANYPKRRKTNEQAHDLDGARGRGLKNELSNQANYFSNVKSIFNQMIIDSSNDELSVLNFNYTNIYDCLKLYDCLKAYTNVHGLLEDNLIIGIDDTNINDERAFPFTKTFRKLTSNTQSIILDTKYDEIIIYGHSLGKQDYAYFQSIFDYVDLYGGNTKLTLIYSDNFINGNSNEQTEVLKKEHKINMAKQLFSLINTYGLKMDNPNHGKNLLHKLILEGRIEMKYQNFIV